MLFWSTSRKFTPPKKFKCKPFSHLLWKFFANRFWPSKGLSTLEIAPKMPPTLLSNSCNCKIRRCRITAATLRWREPVQMTSWRIWASSWRSRIKVRIPNLFRWAVNLKMPFWLINRRRKKFSTKLTVCLREEATTIWRISFKGWSPKIRTKTKGTKTSQWSPMTSSTCFKPFRAWAKWAKTITKVTRTPYYCSSCSKN